MTLKEQPMPSCVRLWDEGVAHSDSLLENSLINIAILVSLI